MYNIFQLFCKCVDYGNFAKSEVLVGTSFQSVILSISFFVPSLLKHSISCEMAPSTCRPMLIEYSVGSYKIIYKIREQRDVTHGRVFRDMTKVASILVGTFLFAPPMYVKPRYRLRYNAWYTDQKYVLLLIL